MLTCVLNLIVAYVGFDAGQVVSTLLTLTKLDSRRAIRHLDGKEYRGRPLVVEESRARPPNSTKVFVGNISATCSADDLHGLFSTFGRVLDCDKVKGGFRT